MRYFLIVAVFGIIFSQLATPCHALQAYDLASADNWNIRIDGAGAGDNLGVSHVAIADLDSDGYNDLVVGARRSTVNGVYETGSLYIIYHTLLAKLNGKGNTLDLADPKNFNIRYDGSGNISFGRQFATGDFDGDGKPDIAVGAILTDYNNRSDSGSVWIVYNTMFKDYSGTGNIINITSNQNFNIRIDAAFGGGYQGGGWFPYDTVRVGDLNGDHIDDLVLGNMDAPYNGATSGSVWLFYNTLLDNFTGTGNTLDLAKPSSYNVRFDGPSGGYLTGYGATYIKDIDLNGKNDLLMGAYVASYNGRSGSGSLYIVYDTLLDDYSTTGNVVNLAIPNSFNIRIDGNAPGSLITAWGILAAGDLDNSGTLDIIIPAIAEDTQGRTNNGALYVVNNSLLLPLTGTGNTLDLLQNGFYNFRLDGPYSNAYISNSVVVADINNDGADDIYGMLNFADNNNRTDSGSYLIVFSSVFNKLTGTGNAIDLGDDHNVSIRFDGAVSSGFDINQKGILKDLNGDGSVDFVLSAGGNDYNLRGDSGSVYIIYNFPHEINIDTLTTPTKSRTFSITGSVIADNSVTPIADVQYSTDNSFAGTWKSCFPTDGTFDEKSEKFSCPVGNFAKGDQSIYFRAVDKNGVYTPQANYVSILMMVDTRGYVTKFRINSKILSTQSNIAITSATVDIPASSINGTENHTSVSNYKTLIFSATSLIPEIKTNTTVKNRLQVHLSNGVNIPLKYTSIEDGYYLWTGSYRLPIKDEHNKLKGVVEGIAYKEPIGQTTHFSNISSGLVNVGATFDFEIKSASAGAYLFNNATNSAAVVYTPPDGLTNSRNLVDTFVNTFNSWLQSMVQRIIH